MARSLRRTSPHQDVPTGPTRAGVVARPRAPKAAWQDQFNLHDRSCNAALEARSEQ
ncbi:MAG TPA: hypothetical protein VFS67_18990 [Polyangiaceae bacterium]|nr:hypothetical protein [Polyangiaceae bacterium]